MMLGDRSDYILYLMKCFIVYMNRNQNNKRNSLIKPHESLSITGYSFQTLIIVHPVIPGSPIENKESLQTISFTIS